MENLDKFAGKLVDYLNSAEVFIGAQMPDFVNQFIAYETWKASWFFWASLTFLLIMIVAQILFCIFIVPKPKDDSGGPGILIIGAVGTFALFHVVHSYADLKKLEIAPKVYMIERAKELVAKRR